MFITSTVEFLGYAAGFFADGADKLAFSGGWHNDILLVLLVGCLAIDTISFLIFSERR